MVLCSYCRKLGVFVVRRRLCSSSLSSCQSKSKDQINLFIELLKLRNRQVVANTFPIDFLDSPHLHESDVSTCKSVYAGFDPTASSLHLGNLVVLMNLLRLNAAGYDGYIILGGATARLGDPSGKINDREQIANDIVEENTKHLHAQLSHLITNFHSTLHPTSPGHISILNNLDWYKDVNLIDFVSSVCSKLRMGALLRRESIRNRLNSGDGDGLSLGEFMYQVVQAYDWTMLYERYGCRVQLGGTDQIGNISTGSKLLSRQHSIQGYGISSPLLTTPSGHKLGKSEGNAVWLCPTLTTPFSFYQHLHRTHDSAIKSYLQLFTLLPPEQIQSLLDAGPWVAQQQLAESLTLLVHGKEGLEMAQKCTNTLYGKTAKIENFAALNRAEMGSLLEHVPSISVPADCKLSVADILVQVAACRNLKEARSQIVRGAIYLNLERETDPDRVFSEDMCLAGHRVVILRLGRKKYYFVSVVG